MPKDTGDFNPLPPCGGRRSIFPSLQPTLYFNPLPPCGGRQLLQGSDRRCHIFQSTPSVWRETFSDSAMWQDAEYFNPLPPCGGRHRSAVGAVRTDGISIHSLRVEGDHAAKHTAMPRSPISIHSLRVEGDRHRLCYTIVTKNFNPLPPCGGRHAYSVIRDAHVTISIHSLRVEGDMVCRPWVFPIFRFQSTPSVWRETCSGTTY